MAARETFKPGRVLWAKVEGHDWWPAKVVRRRAGERGERSGVQGVVWWGVGGVKRDSM